MPEQEGQLNPGCLEFQSLMKEHSEGMLQIFQANGADIVGQVFGNITYTSARNSEPCNISLPDYASITTIRRANVCVARTPREIYGTIHEITLNHDSPNPSLSGYRKIVVFTDDIRKSIIKIIDERTVELIPESKTEIKASSKRTIEHGRGTFKEYRSISVYSKPPYFLYEEDGGIGKTAYSTKPVGDPTEAEIDFFQFCGDEYLGGTDIPLFRLLGASLTTTRTTVIRA